MIEEERFECVECGKTKDKSQESKHYHLVCKECAK